MILLDTNIISVMTRAPGDPVLIRWLDLQEHAEIWTTAITVFEVEYGLARLPQGRRRAGLQTAWAKVLHEDLHDRVVAFDHAAAHAAAWVCAARIRSGITVEQHDTQIAGIAIAHSATIATRNIRHFQDLPTTVIGSMGIGLII